MRIMPAFNIMYNELDNAGIESINAFQYDTGIDPTNTIRHNATLVLYQDAETSHMFQRLFQHLMPQHVEFNRVFKLLQPHALK